jgi:hypothetical protein
MLITHLLAMAAIAYSGAGQSDTAGAKQRQEANSKAFAAADDLMHQCDVSRKSGRLQDAERQCLAAIQVLKSLGWKGQGETCILGMIYYEQGEKRLGFVTLRDSWDGYHGSAEAELYLGRMAIELRETKTAQAVVDRFRRKEGDAGALPDGTRDYWPKGNDPQSLQAIIEFLEGDRLCQTRETRDKGIKLLLHSNKLIPRNVAINYALGRAHQWEKDSLAPAPFFKFVSQNGSGGVKGVADDWLYRNSERLKEAEKAKLR